MAENSKAPMGQSRYERLADLLNEAGMLKNIPRSGFAFLGSGKENVAEHSFRTSIIGYALASLAGADAAKVACMCLFHDLHEARTGDFNYVNHMYDTCRAKDALQDATAGTGLEEAIMGFYDELETNASLEAKLANDADQLDLICNLRLELWKGNQFARDWLDSALKRLQTPEGVELAEAVLGANPNDWWYGRVDPQWWVNRGK